MEKEGLRETLSKDFLSIMREIKKNGAKDEKANDKLYKKKIALLGAGSLQYFAAILKYCLQISGIDAELLIGTYKGLEMDVMDDSSEYNSFQPDVTVIFSSYRDVMQYPAMHESEEKVWEMVWEEIGKYEILWDKIYRRNGSYILQTNLVTPIERKMGNLEANYIWSRQTYLELLNYGFQKKKKNFVSILDFNYLASIEGKEKWFDFPNYYLNKSNMSYASLPGAVEEVVLNILNYCGINKKCIVLDLDNTIWGGILEEAGVENINIFPDDPIGEAFLDFQKYLKGLKERGVILAVCSKNDIDFAKEVFQTNKNMILRLEDISCFIANWENKADNIRQIAADLNIGLNSIVFVDDNPVERDLVQSILPEVEVLALSEDPANYVLDMEKAKYFEWLQITEEDANRTNSYKAKEALKVMLQNYDNYDDYLSSLGMEGSIEEVTPQSIARTAQLFNKSNQFNSVRFRGTEAQLLKLQEEGRILLTCQLRDKFANYGLVACAILEIENDKCIVTAWAMSCRVFKRTLEKYMLNEFTKIALRNRCNKLIVLFIPNERNGMVKEMLEENGFCESADTGQYCLAIDESIYFENKINEVKRNG